MLEQYKAMLKVDNVILEFTKGGIEAVADVAMTLNKKIENIGARRLHTVLEKVLNEIMFEAPYDKEKIIKFGKKDIEKVFDIGGKEENLNDYIL